MDFVVRCPPWPACPGRARPGSRPPIGFVFLRSRFCLRLPSDPASRRRPCPWLRLVPSTPGKDFHLPSQRPCWAYIKNRGSVSLGHVIVSARCQHVPHQGRQRIPEGIAPQPARSEEGSSQFLSLTDCTTTAGVLCGRESPKQPRTRFLASTRYNRCLVASTGRRKRRLFHELARPCRD